jgi:hypothetical protein
MHATTIVCAYVLKQELNLIVFVTKKNYLLCFAGVINKIHTYRLKLSINKLLMKSNLS